MYTMRPIVDYCAYCNAAIREGDDVLYDENTYAHFCSDVCFREWADEHFDKILRFYEELNVSHVAY